MPICSFEDGHDCINGNCVAPNICECFPGYRFLDDRNCTCVPICNPPCINGYCTVDGCICHENFYNISEYECERSCDEGYIVVGNDCMDKFEYDRLFGITELEETTPEFVVLSTVTESTTITETTTEEELTTVEETTR